MTIEELAKQNDLLRTTFLESLGKVVWTDTLDQSGFKEAAFTKVREFTEFTQENDPHGEHDFGAFEIENRKFFWKIDYYDLKYEFGADPLAEPHRKALTIMHAEDY